MDIGDIGAALLEPVQRATDLVSQAIAALGEGVEWTAEQIETFAVLVAALAAKVEDLQAKASGVGDEPAA